MRSWALRSFEAATIFIAFVICCVFLTARIRRRRSISDGIWTLPALAACWPSCDGCFPGREVACEFLHCRVEPALQLIVELLLFDYPREHLRIPRLDELEQFGLEGAHFRHRDVVQIPVRSREDDRHLPFDPQRLVLRLLEDLDEPGPSIELRLR